MIDYTALADTAEVVYDPSVQGRVLIVDGDSFCYKAAATSAKLITAIGRFQNSIEEAMYICKAESAIVHLTHKDSKKAYRGNIIGAKSYQDNRKNASRPKLLHELREAVSTPENIPNSYTCTLHRVVEADDAVMIDSYKLKENGVVWSDDKDLRQTPYNFYDPKLRKIIQADGLGELWVHTTEAGNQSLHGVGRLFFWAQMLMGDAVDNVRGLDKFYGKMIGWSRTFEVLEEFNFTEDESEVANLVLDAYRYNDQNPIPEGYLLHMMRDWGDSFLEVLKPLDLTEANRKFIYEDCLNREWFKE